MTDPTRSLIDLRAISEPACKLIDAVSSAIGAVYEPTRIRRRAKAEADALIALATGEGEVSEIAMRTAERVRQREVRRQENIESITRKAIEELPGEVSSEPVDEDWTYQFFDTCQDVSNETLQSLWARLLAGEVARPGTFSLRALAIIKVMRKEEADLFTRFCTYVWQFPGNFAPVLVGTSDKFAVDAGFLFEPRLLLQSLGLIEINSLSGYTMEFAIGKELPVWYYGYQYRLRLPESARNLRIGHAVLTDIGKQLAPIAGSRGDSKYMEAVLEVWKEQKVEVVDATRSGSGRPG